MKTAALVSSQLILGVLLVLLLQQVDAQSTGLRIIVHSNESGSVCVNSFSQDLGCRDVEGPNEAVFEFSPEAVDINEVIDVCLNDYCQYPMNSVGQEPIQVYFEKGETGISNSPIGNGGNTSTPDSNAVMIFLAVVFIGLLVTLALRGRKHKKREHFPTFIKKEILKKQAYKCAICKKKCWCLGFRSSRWEQVK